MKHRFLLACANKPGNRMTGGLGEDQDILLRGITEMFQWVKEFQKAVLTINANANLAVSSRSSFSVFSFGNSFKGSV